MEIVHIEVLKMPNGEFLSNGKSLGFDSKGEIFKILKRFDALNGEEITE